MIYVIETTSIGAGAPRLYFIRLLISKCCSSVYLPYIPRLAGQNAAYVVGQLALFRSGAHRQSPDMTAVARNLEDGQARAVAAYLQSR